jgi:metal-responsive CopG/Arc/MetJ family transcriptional regulator
MNKLPSKTINISLPQGLVAKIDKAAEEEFATRSDFIRDSILRKLNAQERWEVITDLTSIKRGGIEIDELLKRL